MAKTSSAATPQAAIPARRLFDLNVEKVLEHWTPAEGLREIIANAVDEAGLSHTKDPVVRRQKGGWVVRDFGRGLQYQHLTQKENREKLRQPDKVIGKFGVGLKDALAVFERRAVDVEIRSRYGDIRLVRAAKTGFTDVITLQAEVAPSSNPSMVGTEVSLRGLDDSDVATAKAYFLRFTKVETYDRHELGAVLARPKDSAKIYVNGMMVATEPNFLFSYDVTSTTAALRRALNRERTNVGRQAYSSRVKDLLLRSFADPVVERLVGNLEQASLGFGADETGWTDVGVHACQLLQLREKVVFITSDDLRRRGAPIYHAQTDGYRPVLVPESIGHKLSGLNDAAGNPMRDLGAFVEEWNESFDFKWVDPSRLTKSEARVWSTCDALMARAGTHAERVQTVLISETMRLHETSGEVMGLWEHHKGRIVIKRSQLGRQARFTSTLLHEIAHASSGADHGSMAFEDALTTLLGVFGEASLSSRDRPLLPSAQTGRRKT